MNWALPFENHFFPESESESSADVWVELGELPPLEHAGVTAGPLRVVSQNRTRFKIPDVGLALIENGNHVLIEPAEGATPHNLCLFLIGTAASLILHQRKFLPLHGSGILTPKGVVLFVGHSGAGKSTTLAAMVKRGYPLVCDDLAAIHVGSNCQLSVEPGVQAIKLWEDSANAMSFDTRDYPRVRDELNKYIVANPSQQRVSAQPLHAIYHLGKHGSQDWELVVPDNARRFNVVLDHTWQKMTIKKMGLHASHFRLASAVAVGSRIRLLRRPDRESFELDHLCERLERDFLA